MRAFSLALPWLIALVVGLAYLPALDASFQFDDWQVVLGDARVQSLAAWWHSMPGMRALVKLTFALNHESGSSAADFRAVNILLHTVNTLLVFQLARVLALRLRTTDGDDAVLVAAIVALLFGLHPVQTESVTYIAARPNLVATLFVLLALLAWLRGSVRHAFLWWPLATLCFVLALLGKETAAMLPLAMLLCLAATRDFSNRELWLPLALAALCVSLFAVLWAYTPYDYLLRTSLETRSPVQNLIAQTQGISWLGGQLIRWDRLNADPMLVPPARITLAVCVAGASIVGALIAGVLSLRRAPALGFGILWCLLWLAPTNSLLARLDLANDRQWYLALVGPAWCLGHGLLQLGRRVVHSNGPRVAIPLLVIIAGGLAAATIHRNEAYDTEISFWSDVVDKAPHNTRGWNNLGVAYAQACNTALAAAAFDEAMRRDAGDYRAAVNLALLQQGQLPGVDSRCDQPRSPGQPRTNQ